MTDLWRIEQMANGRWVIAFRKTDWDSWVDYRSVETLVDACGIVARLLKGQPA